MTSDPSHSEFRATALPSYRLAATQSEQLHGARIRLLRQANLLWCRRILDLAAGWGFASEEIAHRSGRVLTAVDLLRAPLVALQRRCPDGVQPVQADAAQLPFEDDCFDLVFAQFAFLWFRNWDRVIAEIQRVLGPTGAVTAIEPDFGGLIEHPVDGGLRDVWLRGLRRSGARPLAGRELAVSLQEAGFEIRVALCDRLEAFQTSSLGILAELDLMPADRSVVERSEKHPPKLCHLPLFLIHGVRTG